MAQAKNYAGKLAVRFTYSSNGQGVYAIDMREGTEGEVPRFPTPDELWSQYAHVGDMASVYKRTRNYSIPSDAEMTTRNGRRFARAAGKRRRRPLADHMEDYRRYLASKGNTAKHCDSTVRYIEIICQRCNAEHVSDLHGAAVLQAVGELRSKGVSKRTKDGQAIGPPTRTC